MSEVTPTAHQVEWHAEHRPEHEPEWVDRYGHVKCKHCLAIWQEAHRRNQRTKAEPSERQVMGHAKRHDDHEPHWRHTERSGWRCVACAWQSSREAQGQSTDLADWRPMRGFTVLTPPPMPEVRVAPNGLADEPSVPSGLAVEPSVVRALTPNGVTVGQLVRALGRHHPDDRVEVARIQPRRRGHGHRVDVVVIVPGARTEAGA